MNCQRHELRECFINPRGRGNWYTHTYTQREGGGEGVQWGPKLNIVAVRTELLVCCMIANAMS